MFLFHQQHFLASGLILLILAVVYFYFSRYYKIIMCFCVSKSDVSIIIITDGIVL